MADDQHGIAIGVDASRAESGLASLDRALGRSAASLAAFDRSAQATFSALARTAASASGANLSKAFSVAGPSKAAVSNFSALAKALSSARINPSTGAALASVTTAASAFRAPSIAAVRNLGTLIRTLETGSPSRVAAMANALNRLRGFSVGSIRTGNVGGSRGGVATEAGALTAFNGTLASTNQLLGLFGVSMAAFQARRFISGITDAGAALFTFQKTILAVATSADEFASDKSFINTLTRELPIGLADAQTSFGKFAVSARLSGVSVKETQEIFRSFATAFSVLGLDSESQSKAFLAIEQIYNKNRVMAEELRRQLAQYLPGAFELFAQSIGKSTAELDKLMRAGKVPSSSVLPFARLVAEIYAGRVPAALAQSRAQMLLLQNAFTEFQQTTYGAGVNSGIAAFAQTLRTALPANELDGLAQRIGGGFRTIAVAVAALGSVALQHVDGILRFGGALASFLALQSVASILSRLSPSFLLLGASAALAASADPKFRTLAVGVGVLTAGFVALNAELAATLARVLIIPAAATAGLLVVGEGLKKIGVPGFGFDDFKKVVGAAADALDIGGILKKLNDDINGALSAGASNLSGLPGVKEITDAFAEASKAADAFAAKQADLGSQYDANAARAARAAALQADADALTTKQQSLLDRADPIGKATRAYREQLDLLHQLVAAKQISADQERAIAGRLAASTLAERDPFAALVKSMREEADVLALTGDSREVENKLLQQKNDLLKAGVDLTADQIAALRQLDAAMLDMQHGGSNGFAQWSASAKDFKTSINDAEKNGVEGLSNALADVVTKGKADFASLAQSILHDLAKAVIQSWLKDALAGFGGGAASLTAALANASRVSAATPPVGIVPNAISTPVVNVYAGSVAFAGGIGSDFAAAANSAGVTKMIPGSYPIVPSGSFSGSFMDAFPALNAASNLTGANGRLNPAAAFSYLRSAGLSDVAASAVLGNLKQESSFNPNIWGDGGSSFGLGQWNGDRLASLRGFAGSTTPDAKSQLDFLLSELRGSESRAGSALFGANDLSSANSAMKMFERYGDASQGTRLSFSQDIFNQFSQSTGQLTGAMTAAANAAQLSAGGMGSLASTLTQSAIPALSQIGAGMIGGGGGGLSSWLATLPAFDTGGLTKGAGPAMLHDNEAVVPLTRGGAIPVEGGRNGGSGRAIINMPITIMATDAASFGRSQKQIGRKLQERVHRAAYE